MARISEQTNDSQTLKAELGISLSSQELNLFEKYYNMNSENEDLGNGPVQTSLKSEDLWYDPVQTIVQGMATVLEGYRKKFAWRSRTSPSRKSKTIISPFAMMWTVFMAMSFTLPYASVRAEIIESPENQVILVNTNVIMKCRTNSTTKPVVWSGNGKGSEPVSIFDGETVNPLYTEIFSVTPDAGRYYLSLKATPQWTLKFKCIEASADPVERSATLVVLESDPKCTAYDTANPEYIDIACTINVSGNWIPKMIWRVNGAQELLTTNLTKRQSDPYVEFTSTLYNVPRKYVHKYVCDTLFVPEMHDENVTAVNVPSYKFTALLLPELPPSTLASTLPPMAPTSTPPSNWWRNAFMVVVVLASISIIAIIAIAFALMRRKEYPNDQCGCTLLPSCVYSDTQDTWMAKISHAANPNEQTNGFLKNKKP